MANWTLAGVRTFVQQLNDSDVQTIARLNPLGGGTTLHTFGYEDEITKLKFYIVGLADKAALKAAAKDDTFHTLTTPYGTWGDYKIKQISFELVNLICQTLRPDLPENSPVFSCDCELYRNE